MSQNERKGESRERRGEAPAPGAARTSPQPVCAYVTAHRESLMAASEAAPGSTDRSVPYGL